MQNKGKTKPQNNLLRNIVLQKNNITSQNIVNKVNYETDWQFFYKL